MRKYILETALFLLIIGQIGFLTTYLSNNIAGKKPLFIEETIIALNENGEQNAEPVYRLRDDLKPYELVYLARKEADRIIETGNLDTFTRQLDNQPIARMMLGI